MGPAAPGKLHWFHLAHGPLLLAGEGQVGVAMWQKEVCESTSAWNCKRRPGAAAVTQLLAAALHVPAQHYCRTAKGKDPVLGRAPQRATRRTPTQDFKHQNFKHQLNVWGLLLFSMSKKKILYIKLVLLNSWLRS